MISKKDKERLDLLNDAILNLNKSDLKESKNNIYKLMDITLEEINKKERRKEKYKKMKKALVFIEHIEKHLDEIFEPTENVKVTCRVCEKTIDEIYEEYKENKK